MTDGPLVVRGTDATTVRMSGDRGQSIRLIDEHVEYERMNARFNTLETDDAGRRHHHPGSDLLCYIVSGRLRLETPGGTDYLDPGDLALIPAGMDHAISKASQEALSFLEVYVPGRPEFVYT